jgi:hypothetical protein
LRRDSIHDVALIVGECAALLKLHLQDRITIENKVIKRLVEEKAVPELIFTPPVRPARKANKWQPNLRTTALRCAVDITD